MKFVSVASIIALAAAAQASPAVVTITKTADAVAHTVVTVPRIHYLFKTVYVTAGGDDASSSESTAPESTAFPTEIPDEASEEDSSSSELSESESSSEQEDGIDSVEPEETTTSITVATSSVPTETEAPTLSSSSSSSSSSEPSSTSSESTGDVSDWMTTMICRINAVRASHGVEPLGISSVLDDLALEQSEYQNSIQQMTHDNPAGGLGSRLTSRGISWSGAAENVAAGMQSAEQAQQALENSAGHLANMVSTNMAYVGVGRINGYYTQEFYALPGNGRPDTVPNCS